MFDSFDSANREIDQDQFVDTDVPCNREPEPDNCVTLIGKDNYGLEVEMSGYVCVEKDLLEAEAFLASLYPRL
jgi:hypothetical protein